MRHIDIIKRAENDARDNCPEMPKANTYEAWEYFASTIRDYRESAYEIAAQCADSWDWVIYYAQAMDVCLAVDSATLNDAESRAYECGAADVDESTFGLFETAGRIAYHICEAAIAEAIETLCDDMEEMANHEMDNAA